MSSKERNLDLFALLNGLSRNDYDYYQSLSDDEKKEVLPLIVMRWMSGTSDVRQVYFLNELVNQFVFPFYKHKDLLVRLLSICGSGRNTRYQWLKSQSKRKTSSPMVIGVIKEYFGYNTIDAIDALQLLSSDDILDYASQLGRQPDEVSKIKKELKTHGND